MGFAVEALDFEHACVTKSGESGKDCEGVAAQKNKRERTDFDFTEERPDM